LPFSPLLRNVLLRPGGLMSAFRAGRPESTE
jgi:hypothetical protein